MTKQPIPVNDPLIAKIRDILKAIEPRPTPTEERINQYGGKQLKCPDCGEWCYTRNGSYNHHWTLRHGTPFWKEKQIAKLVRGEQ